MYLKYDDLKKIIPLLSIAAMCIGYLNKHLYYKNFGIYIFNYLETSEVLIAAGKDILKYGLIMTLTGVFHFIIVSVREIENEGQAHFDTMTKSNFRQRLKMYYKQHDYVFFIIIILLLNLLILRIFWPDKKTSLSFTLSPILFVAVVIMRITYNELDYKLTQLDYDIIGVTYKNLTLVLICICYFSVINADSEYKSVLTKGKYEDSYFISEGRIYVCDSFQTIIGETKSYVFFYNKRDSTTQIFNRDIINEYQIKVNKLNSSF